MQSGRTLRLDEGVLADRAVEHVVLGHDIEAGTVLIPDRLYCVRRRCLDSVEVRDFLRQDGNGDVEGIGVSQRQINFLRQLGQVPRFFALTCLG